MGSKPIIFFDGVCNLCNGLVDLIFRLDRDAKFMLSSLQGETAKTLLPKQNLENLDSVVLFRDGKFYYKAEAVALILKELAGFWSYIGTVLTFLPDRITLTGYNLVANNRYRVFGKRETCRLPTLEEKERFLP